MRMTEIGEPEERPLQVPTPWRWPRPRREEAPDVPPVEVPREPERVPG